jgi:cystathionine beta-lyase
MTEFDVADITIDELRLRRSAKWRQFPTDVIPAWVAEMDFPLAAPIATALHNAIDRSDTGYRSAEGVAQALAIYTDRTWGWAVEPADVVVVPDVISGIVHALRVLTAEGDGVVINPPVYPPFFMVVRDVTKRRIVDVAMKKVPGAGWDWDLEALEEAFARPDVTAYVMSSPHNPTGSVATPQTLAAIAELAERHGVAVISDEIHAPLVLPGATFTPYLTVAGPDARAVTVIASSKAWNTPGLKCAQIVSTPRASSRIGRSLPLEVAFGTGHLGAIAAVAAYMDGQAWLDQVVSILDANRHLIADLLGENLPEVRYVPPQASYLAWLDMRSTGLGDDPSTAILERGRLALNAGPAFGLQGKGFARMNFGTSPDLVREIVDRLVSVFQ